MKKTLAVYILYHTQYEQGKETYESLYKLLCRDADHPFEDGLDIPVYLRTGDDAKMKDIKPIDLETTEKAFVLLLIDNNMYCSAVWKDYIKSLNLQKENHKDALNITCVELSKFALDIGLGLVENQFIRLNTFSIKENWQEFQIRLFDDLIRFIKSGSHMTKLKIFISHSKKDKNRIGQDRALEFRDYIRSKTKLDSFFDANDILDGHGFEEQILANATDEASLLVILNSNTYSEREWCQKEVLFAKREKVPTIAVSLLDGEVKRSFPYISNIPYIRFDNNWPDILVLILRTALDQFSQELYLNSLKQSLGEEQSKRFQILPFSPEAYSYVYDELKSDIIYPEPPLTKVELEVLKKIAGTDKKFLTPMQLLAESINISGKHVAISVSEAPESDILGYGTAMIRDLTIELSRHLLIAGAKMVYGGDLRNHGYTELLSELSLQYKEYQSSTDRDTYFYRNFFAWPIWLTLTQEAKLQFVNSRVDTIFVNHPDDYSGNPERPIAPINNENNLVWAKSLLKMRRQMENAVNARVILGGRLNHFKGYISGVAEEFILAHASNHPVYLLGGFGGTASMLTSLIQGQTSVEELKDIALKDDRYRAFYRYCQERNIPMGYEKLESICHLGVDCLDNGLSNRENEILFRSTDVVEIVGLILKGMKRKIGTK